jgi:hypothetical protein
MFVMWIIIFSNAAAVGVAVGVDVGLRWSCCAKPWRQAWAGVGLIKLQCAHQAGQK